MISPPIAIFGGTFNPIHNGHLRSAIDLAEQLQFAEVRLMPAAQPPHRDAPQCSAQQRADLVELAIAGEACLRCDRRELNRPGPSYTVDSLLELREELGLERSLCLVLGSDALQGLDQWHRWRELTDLAHLVVLARPGWTLPQAGEVADWASHHLTNDAASLQHKACGAVLVQQLSQLEISSTTIRSLIAADRSPRYLLPEPVWDQIKALRLYGYSAA